MNEVESDECYNRIVEECKTFKTSFDDPDFPSNGKKCKRFTWLRPHQINTEEEEEEWSVMNNPVPTDVVKSPWSGGCWLMTPIAAIANRPDILNNIFPSKEVSPYGVYRVKLFLNEKWEWIIMDDYIPCFVESKKMAVGFARRKQLWVSLIEKALVKAFGSYSVLGNPSLMLIAFSWLTGAHSQTEKVPTNPDEVDEFWTLLMDSKSANFLITCDTILDEETHEKIHGECTVPDHTFLILDVNDEYDHRLLRLQNPWGAVEWYGKWSNDWDGWPEDMKEKLLDDRKEELTAFWIELDDFINMVKIITICRVRPNHHEFRETLTIGLDTQTIRFTITQTCEAVFEATSKHQENAQLHEDVIMSIHRISKNNEIGEMVGNTGHRFAIYKSTEDLMLDPGEYIIILLNIRNKNRRSIPMNIVCYSTKSISYELVQQSTKILKQALREVILKSGTLETTSHVGIRFRSFRKNMLLMVENFTSDKYYHITIDASKKKSFVSSRGSMRTTDVIPPKSYKIVMNLFKDWSKPFRWGPNSMRSIVSSEKYINAECTCDPSITDRRLTSYPSIDASDWVHSTESLSHEINQMDEDVKRSMNIL